MVFLLTYPSRFGAIKKPNLSFLKDWVSWSRGAALEDVTLIEKRKIASSKTAASLELRVSSATQLPFS